MDTLTRRRAMLWLERPDFDERSRGYNPAPGQQVFTTKGERKYGLPIGATIPPGMRALTAAQHDEVAAMPPDVRARYLQARAQGHTHAAARKAAGGSPPPRKAAAKKAVSAAPAEFGPGGERVTPGPLSPRAMKILRDADASGALGRIPVENGRHDPDIQELHARGLVKHYPLKGIVEITPRGRREVAPAKAAPSKATKKAAAPVDREPTPARKSTAAAKKAAPSRESFDPKSLEGLPVRQQRARLRAMGFSKEQVDELAPTAAMAKKAAPKGPSMPRLNASQTDVLHILSNSRESGGSSLLSGYKPDSRMGKAIESLVATGMVRRDGDRLAITEQGHAALAAARERAQGAFDAAGLAERISGMSDEQIFESLKDLNATQLASVARQFPGEPAIVPGTFKPSARTTVMKLPAGLSLEEKRRWLAKQLGASNRWHWRSQDLAEDDIERADFDDDDLEDDEPVDELDLALEHYEPEKPLDPAARSRALAMRAVGHDITPGHDQLHHYWTRGEGLARWVGSPKPWTTLVAHLSKYVSLEKAKRFASRWFIEVFHFAAGSDLNRVMHGHPPRGHVIGPDRSVDDAEEDRAGYSPRHPYPGQKYVHGWIPVELATVIRHISRWHDDPKDVDDLARSVSRGATHAGPLSYGRSHRTRAELTDFGDGTDGIVTDHLGGDPVRDADADQLASTLARGIGIPAPRKMRVADDMTADELVDGPTWAEREAQILGDVRAYERESPVVPVGGRAPSPAALKRQQADLERQRAEMLASDAALRIGVLDLLAGIDERDKGTVAIGADGVVPVQSEFGWIYADGNLKPATAARRGKVHKADGAVAPVERRVAQDDLVMWSAFSNLRSWRDNPLTAADVAWLRARLDEAQPQFAKLGRMRWWQFASDRLDALARHAKGTRDLFATG